MDTKRLWISGALFALIGSATASADAAVYGTMNGSACQSVYDNTWPYGTNIFYNGNINSNDAVNAKYVVCPLPRQNVTSTNGLSAAYVTLNDPTSGSMWCQLTSFDFFGNVVASSGAIMSGGNGKRLVPLTGIATSSAWGNYSLFCTMPPRGSSGGAATIYSYLWVEN